MLYTALAVLTRGNARIAPAHYMRTKHWRASILHACLHMPPGARAPRRPSATYVRCLLLVSRVLGARVGVRPAWCLSHSLYSLV